MGVVMWACVALFAVAVGLTARWGRVPFRAVPDPEGADGRWSAVQRTLWWVELWLGTVLFAGLLVIGAGGRLAMRLLGALGGDSAQGRLTEADEVVGEITAGGTIGFMVFVGLLAGFFTVAAYLLLRRYLPAGPLGGALFGVGLFVVAATRSDPLRPENRDFDIVGPWWVAVAVFAALALVYGLAVRSFVNRFSNWLPLPGRNRRSAAYLLLALLVPIVPIAVAVLVALAVAALAGRRVRALGEQLGRPPVVRAVRAALVVGFLVALPGFVSGVGDIAGRGPSL